VWLVTADVGNTPPWLESRCRFGLERVSTTFAAGAGGEPHDLIAVDRVN